MSFLLICTLSWCLCVVCVCVCVCVRACRGVLRSCPAPVHQVLQRQVQSVCVCVCVCVCVRVCVRVCVCRVCVCVRVYVCVCAYVVAPWKDGGSAPITVRCRHHFPRKTCRQWEANECSTHGQGKLVQQAKHSRRIFASFAEICCRFFGCLALRIYMKLIFSP